MMCELKIKRNFVAFSGHENRLEHQLYACKTTHTLSKRLYIHTARCKLVKRFHEKLYYPILSKLSIHIFILYN